MPALGWSRYDWTIHLTADQRQTITRKSGVTKADNVIPLPLSSLDGAPDRQTADADEPRPTQIIDLRKRA